MIASGPQRPPTACTAARHLGCRDQLAQRGVASRRTRQYHNVGPHGVGASGALWPYSPAGADRRNASAASTGHQFTSAMHTERQPAGAIGTGHRLRDAVCVERQLSAEHCRQPGFVKPTASH